MKKIIFVLAICIFMLTGCHEAAKNLGGNITLELDPGRKLEEITWKDSSLWYLTRPMRDIEQAETHIFQCNSEFGVFEGSVTVIEKEGE